MIHKPIEFKNICLSFPHKSCFEDFSAQIPYGSRIAIIGRNGSGKTSLLKMLNNIMTPTSGEIILPGDIRCGYLPQIIEDFATQSGGQRLNTALTGALCADPNCLLLDEPTNHLDKTNRQSLMRMLRTYSGTLIIVSHDVELLRRCVDTLWHIDNAQVRIFKGNYDDYQRELVIARSSLQDQLALLHKQKHAMHQSLMHEQTRAAKSRSKGEKNIADRKWPTIVSQAKARRAEETSGKKRSEIDEKKKTVNEQLAHTRLPEIIKPKFSLTSSIVSNKMLVSIIEGRVCYGVNPIINRINLAVASRDRIAIQGDNGTGKSTLFNAILHDPNIDRTGEWTVPKQAEIGFLDQHYKNIDPCQTVIDNLQQVVPSNTHAELRCHLNEFLFRKNEEVNALVSSLSGGEKARLSLALISAKTPRLLLLDEMTNNLDLETREHVVQVLKEFPGALLVISHDEDFLDGIGITRFFKIENGLFNSRG